MGKTVISVENISKHYRLGVIDRKTFGDEFHYFLKKIFRRKLDDFVKIGDEGRIGAKGLFKALDNVSFTVEQGDVIGLIGTNGSGKSTLLKVLTRITEPTSGKAMLDGRVGSLLEVGTGFHPDLTGRENIYLSGAVLGMHKHEIDDKFDEIVKFSGVENFLDTPVRRYSSGMYVRLGFAVAAHLEPEILLIDEVLAVGDAEFQKKCLSKMNDIAKGGRTIIFVSHNMNAVRELCNKCVWLKDGKVYKQGPSAQIVDDYLRETASGAGVFPIVAPLDPVQIDSMTTSFEGDDLIIENKISSSALVQTVEVVNIIKTNTSEMIAKANFVNTNVAINELNGSATMIVRFPGLKKLLTNGHYYIDVFLNNPYVRTYVSRTKALEFTIDDKQPINSRENNANNFGLLNISPTCEVK
ncbi:MAG: ABC transporter ATP-binding protein [Kiritimatiellae bacterium]|nr:ABC transporter ATP-binding protein [Kiritimatiellia bacterium]